MPWIEKRSSGWRIRYRVPGQPTIPSIDGFPTKAAAQAYLDTMTTHAPTHTHPLTPKSVPTTATGEPAPSLPEPEQPTDATIPPDAQPLTTPDPAAGVRLRDWVDTWWTALDVADNTEAQYRSLLKNHILPTWGDHALTDLSRIELQAWQKHLPTRYAHTTVTTLRKLLARICADAVDEGHLATNPVRRARGGRMIHPAHPPALTTLPRSPT